MNNKIPLRLLAESLAEKTGISTEQAQIFIKTLFQHIADGLYAGEDVSVDGLGQFMVANDVNNPIEFQPCEELVDELNAPFALFSPVEIHDKESIDSIKNIDIEFDTPSTESEDDKAPAEENETVNDEELPDSTEILTQKVIDTVANISPAEIEESFEQGDSEESIPVTDEILPPPLPEEIDYSEVSKSKEYPEDVELSDVEVSTLSEAEELEAVIAPEIIEDLVQEKEPLNLAVEEPNEPQTSVDSEQFESEMTVIPESEEQKHEYYVRKSSRFGLGFIIGLIVGLLLGAIALACYAIYFVNTGLSLL